MILFIDDEPQFVEAYVMELQDISEIVLARDADKALALFAEHQARIELVILDIMMPAGHIFQDVDTKRGRRTGVYLYHEMRVVAPRLPFIILTNLSDPEIERVFDKDNRCRLIRKYEYLPHEVKKFAQDLLA